MEPSTLQGEGDAGTRRPEPDAARLRRFLRSSHIFSAAVQELLEERSLAEIHREPLTSAQLRLLKLIALTGDQQVGAVADLLGVSSAAVSKAVGKLERLGLVVRTPSPGDRRATLLSPSPAGRALVREHERLEATRVRPVLGDLCPEEIDVLVALLERLAVSLYRRDGGESGFCLRCGAYCERNCALGLALGGCPYERIHHEERPPLRTPEEWT